MKKILGLLLMAAAGLAAPASGANAVSEIEALLPAETFRMARSAALSGRFVQTRTLKGLARPLRSSGRFAYARDHGVLWSVQQPFAEDYVFSGDRLIATGGASPPAFGTEIARLLTALFTLELTALERSFALQAQRDKSGWNLRLIPRHRALSAALREVRLEGRRHLQRVRIEDDDGNLTRIDLSQLRVVKALPAEVLAKFQ